VKTAKPQSLAIFSYGSSALREGAGCATSSERAPSDFNELSWKSLDWNVLDLFHQFCGFLLTVLPTCGRCRGTSLAS